MERAAAVTPFWRRTTTWLFWLMPLFLCACYYGSPSAQTSGSSKLVNPTDKASLRSDDGRLTVDLPSGSVSRPTLFSITRLPSEKFPDLIGLYGLVSDVYVVEPARALLKPARVTLDISELKDGSFPLVKVAGRNALTLRSPQTNAVPIYIGAVEPSLLDLGRQVLTTEVQGFGAYGAFWHECYRFCERQAACPGNPAQAGGGTLKQLIDACMAQYGCPGNVEAMNGPVMQSLVGCSKTHACADSYGCCLTATRCETPQPEITDGDPEADPEPPAEIEAETEEPMDGDLDADSAEPDLDREADFDDDFAAATCIAGSSSGCGTGTCVSDNRLGTGGYCLPMTSVNIAAYRREASGYVASADTPDLSCVGQAPSSNPQLQYKLRIKLGDWWAAPPAASGAISVRYLRPTNLTSPMASGYIPADGNGQFVFADHLSSDEWFVLRSEREDSDPQKRLMPTYEWGLYVPRAVAELANATSTEVTIEIHPLTEARYHALAVSMGVSGGMPFGAAMIVGQALDCASPPHVLANVSVGLMQAAPKVWGYLDTTLGEPLPLLGQGATQGSGLFVGLYLPPLDPLSAFAFARSGGTPQLVGRTQESGGRQLATVPNSVSIIRFNRHY